MRGLLPGVILAVGVLACRFDPSGLAEPQSAAVDGGGAGADASAAPDAVPPCLDVDGDGAWVATQVAASCPEPADCDDSDDRARPDQPGFFGSPTNAGGFDFDCNGEEEPYDTTQGEMCHDSWFVCVGSGWLGTVPACGESASWHECTPGAWGCEESSSTTTVMQCR